MTHLASRIQPQEFIRLLAHLRHHLIPLHFIPYHFISFQSAKSWISNTASNADASIGRSQVPAGVMLEPLRAFLQKNDLSSDIIKECEEIVMKSVVNNFQERLKAEQRKRLQLLQVMKQLEVREGGREVGRGRAGRRLMKSEWARGSAWGYAPKTQLSMPVLKPASPL